MAPPGSLSSPPPTRPPRPSHRYHHFLPRPVTIAGTPETLDPRIAAALALPPPIPASTEEAYEVTDCESDYSDDEEAIPSQQPILAGLRPGPLRVQRDIEAYPTAPAPVSESSQSTPSTLTPNATPPLKPQEFSHPVKESVHSGAKDDLFSRHGLPSAPLPPKPGPRFYRNLRWNFGSVYRRLFAIVYLANLAVMAYLAARRGMTGDPTKFTWDHAATAATANVLAAVLVRNEHVVNALFRIACSSWIRNSPLWVRRRAAKVYSYGGIHSGGAVAATSWYLAFVVLLTIDWAPGKGDPGILRGYIYLASYLVLGLLICMLASAYPSVRRAMHNWFEGIHRFMGWLAVILLWVQVFLLAIVAGQASNKTLSLGEALAKSPNFWMLMAITLLIIYPWTRLRSREVEAEVLSEHCLKLTFRGTGLKADFGQAFRITNAPLKETHAFGVVPLPTVPRSAAHHCAGCTCTSASSDEKPQPKDYTPSERPDFALLIAKAGDWTSNLIANPPTRIYTRGVPQFGVLRVAMLFSPVVIVATGAGIAPCLGLFHSAACKSGAVRVRVVWAARAPAKSFGEDVVRTVYEADPNAVIVDTDEEARRAKARGVKSRPDLVGLTYRVWEEGREVVSGQGKKRAEAMVIISNQKVTEKVVYGLETRGVPAFGAIFDS